MKTKIVPIGNSKGIRIPKVLLKECNIEDQVEILRVGEKLVIKSVVSSPRRGWDEAFRLMRDMAEDAPLLDEGVEDLEAFDWK